MKDYPGIPRSFTVENDTDKDFENVRLLGMSQLQQGYGYPELKFRSERFESYRWISDQSMALLMIDIAEHPFKIGQTKITGLSLDEFLKNKFFLSGTCSDANGNSVMWPIDLFAEKNGMQGCIASEKQYHLDSTCTLTLKKLPAKTSVTFSLYEAEK